MNTLFLIFYILGIPVTLYFMPKRGDIISIVFLSLIWPLFIFIALPFYLGNKYNSHKDKRKIIKKNKLPIHILTRLNEILKEQNLDVPEDADIELCCVGPEADLIATIVDLRYHVRLW